MVESTVRDELREGIVRLRAVGVETPQLDAEVLLENTLGVSRTYLIAHPDRRLEPEELDKYHAALSRREKREPLPYITGRREFWGLEFYVTPSVLIPRPETEVLVEEAVNRLKGRATTIVDVGIGSGAIAVAIARELSDVKVLGIELSSEAMEVATANVVKHEVEGKVSLLQGDLLEPLEGVADGLLDAVVSNPPYIPSKDIDGLQPEVAVFEPRGALDGGEDGLVFIRRILADSIKILKPGGFILLEIGSDQGPAVKALADSLNYTKTSIIKDLAGQDRVFSGVWEVEVRR